MHGGSSCFHTPGWRPLRVQRTSKEGAWFSRVAGASWRTLGQGWNHAEESGRKERGGGFQEGRLEGVESVASVGLGEAGMGEITEGS